MSNKVLKGSQCNKQNNYALIHIDSFSAEIKELIRENITTICHGKSIASRSKNRITSNYENTIKELLVRLDTNEKFQKGMVGELLTHILINYYYTEYYIISPFFNLEQRSIKKGFDIVLFSKKIKDIFITEVKSGELNKSKDSSSATRSLLNIAKSDLKTRLNKNVSIWQNALYAAIVAIHGSNIMNSVIELLEDTYREIISGNTQTSNKNVIIVSVLFNTLCDKVKESTIIGISKEIIDENLFKSVIVLSIQKETYQKVIDFFAEEIKNI